MALPGVGGFSTAVAAEMGRVLRELGMEHGYIRANTERVDNLRSALIATRHARILDDGRARMLRLFFCGEELAAGEIAEVTGTELVQALVRTGVLVEESGQVRFPFHLRTAAGLYIQSDYLGDEPDAVMGAGETTAILYRAAQTGARVGRVLDLGCGAGTLALLLARTAEQAVGTDINPRAVELGRWNAALNGIGNAEFRTGSLYEPVAGERFDLLVSQPPYYPRAGEHLTFLHGGERGDEIARAVIEGLPGHLTEVGRALVFTSWPEDSAPRELAGFRGLELSSTRRELHRTRQGMNVFERCSGRGWNAEFSVPADIWGDVRPERIAQLMRTQEYLREGGGVRTVEHAAVEAQFYEGGQLFIRFAPETLLGLRAVDPAVWAEIVGARETGSEVVRYALAQGYLSIS